MTVDYATLTIDDLQRLMMRGELSSKALTVYYFERIAAHNESVHAVLEVNPDALQIAEALDAERKTSGMRGSLHGIPVLLKDNIDTADKLHTSAGSIALAASCAAEDAEVARRLRAAGAVILGKANMTEWANFMAEDMPSGYSSRGGQVQNPYGPGTFDVGGSSSGSGAAVAADFCTIAIGTETSGSILSPASSNAVVGIKPTVGLVSRRGIIPIAHSQDTAGPLARSVRDAAVGLTVIAGLDARDPATGSAVAAQGLDYTLFLDRDGLRGARIGVPRTPYYEHLSEGQRAIMEQAIAALRDAGAVVIDPVLIPSAGEGGGYDVLLYEFKPDLNAYLRTVDPRLPVHTLEELIAYNAQHADVALRHGQKILEDAQAQSGTLTEAVYLRARVNDLRRSQTEGIDAVIAEHALDALLMPANYGAAIAAKAGYPSVCVPGGFMADGEPFGVTFTGLAWSEPTLIRLAYAYEQATQWRKPPVLSQSL